MAYVVKSNWFEMMIGEDENETEDQDEAVESAPPASDDAEAGETADPDFEEVSIMLLGEEQTRESVEPTNTSEAVESDDYIPYLENISVQVGVLDVCLVLYLLIWIFRQFVRVPR